MATGHLVTDLQLALDRHIDLDHLDHARRQIITPLELFDLVGKYALDQFFTLFEPSHDLGGLALDLTGLAEGDLLQIGERNRIKHLRGNLLAFTEKRFTGLALENGRCILTNKKFFEFTAS